MSNDILEESKNKLLHFLKENNIDSGIDLVPISKLYGLQKLSNSSIEKSLFPIVLQYFVKVQNGNVLINKSSSQIDLLISQSKQKNRSATLHRYNTPKNYQGFIKFYNFKPGKRPVSGPIFYELYKTWVSTESKTTLVGMDIFYDLCKLFFKYKPSQKHGTLFYINKTLLSPQVKDHIKTLTNEKIQQKQIKTRSTRP